MHALVWSDVHLDVAQPLVLACASITENKKTEPIPLHDELAKTLRAFREYWGTGGGKGSQDGG